LDRRIDLNRLLISYRKLLSCRIKIWELYERCDMSRSVWILWYIVYCWEPVCGIWTYLLWWM